MLNNSISDTLKSYDIFKDYISTFENDTKAKNIKKKRINARYTETDRKVELEKYILNSICTAEKEKIYFFMLAVSNPQSVLIVKSPSTIAERKQFLGYEWSGAKGNEGIKYIGTNVVDDEDMLTINQGINQIVTPLFNPDNLDDGEKINALIRTNFEGEHVEITENLKEFVLLVNLVDMLDFSRVTFDKALLTSGVKKIEIQSKFPLVKLGEIAEVLKGKSITSVQTKEGNIKVVAGGQDFAYLHNEANRPAKTITISASGAYAGFVNYWDEPIFASDCTTIRGKSELETLYIYHFLQSIQEQIYLLQKGAAQPHVYPDDIKTIPIPEITKELQEQIVKECNSVDADYNTSRMTIEEYKEKIAKVFENLEVVILRGVII